MKHANPLLPVLVLVLLLPIGGCTTMHAVDVPTVPIVFERVAKGDHVKIRTTDGREYDLEVTAVDRDGITGRAQSRQTYKVPYTAIATLEVSEFSWALTAGRVLLGVQGAVYAAYTVLVVGLVILVTTV